MQAWRELEIAFREIAAGLYDTRLDSQWGDAGEHWHLAGGADLLTKKRFEILAEISGHKLLSQVNSIDPADLRDAPNDQIRWYRALWGLGRTGEYKFPAQMLDDSGNVIGHITTGSIGRPAEASALLCLKLQARDVALQAPDSVQLHSQQPRPSRLAMLWEKYGKEIIVGLIVTVVGGLMLAFIL